MALTLRIASASLFAGLALAACSGGSSGPGVATAGTSPNTTTTQTGSNRGPLASFGGPIADLIGPPEALYWRGAVLGDLGRHREALRSIEGALHVLGDEPHWLLEELFHEKVTMLDALGLHDAAVAACAAGLERCPGSALLRAAMGPAERARVRGTLRVLRGGQ